MVKPKLTTPYHTPNPFVDQETNIQQDIQNADAESIMDHQTIHQLFEILTEKYNLTYRKTTDQHCLYIGPYLIVCCNADGSGLYLKHLPLFSCNADGGLSLWQQNNLSILQVRRLTPQQRGYTLIDINDPNSLQTIEQTIKIHKLHKQLKES